MRWVWAISRWGFVGLAILLLIVGVSLLLPNFHNRPEVGCYSRDLGFECQGFFGSKVLSFVLEWPLWVFFYGPFFLSHEITSGVTFKRATNAPLHLCMEIVAVCWLALGLIYPFRWLFLRLRRRSQS
jgi:hypothetical protein